MATGSSPAAAGADDPSGPGGPAPRGAAGSGFAGGSRGADPSTPAAYTGAPTSTDPTAAPASSGSTGARGAGGSGGTTGLSARQQDRIEQALDRVRTENGLDVSVLVGDLDLADPTQFRAGAERLHAALGPRVDSAVLVVAAPGQRRVEIVTGPSVRRRVPDRVCALAVLSMTTAFGGGDIAGGIVDGLRQIADSAGRRETLNPADQKMTDLAVRDDGVAGSASAPAAGAGADEVQSTGHH